MIQDSLEVRCFFFVLDAIRPLLDFAKCPFTHRVTNGLIPSPMPSPILVPAAFRTAELNMTTNPMQAAGKTCDGSNGFWRRGLRSSSCTLSTGHFLDNSSRNCGSDRRSSDNTTGTSSIGMKTCSGSLVVTTLTTGDMFALFRDRDGKAEGLGVLSRQKTIEKNQCPLKKAGIVSCKL
jgi:hypothetical protein